MLPTASVLLYINISHSIYQGMRSNFVAMLITPLWVPFTYERRCSVASSGEGMHGLKC